MRQACMRATGISSCGHSLFAWSGRGLPDASSHAHVSAFNRGFVMFLSASSIADTTDTATGAAISLRRTVFYWAGQSEYSWRRMAGCNEGLGCRGMERVPRGTENRALSPPSYFLRRVLHFLVVVVVVSSHLLLLLPFPTGLRLCSTQSICLPSHYSAVGLRSSWRCSASATAMTAPSSAAVADDKDVHLRMPGDILQNESGCTLPAHLSSLSHLPLGGRPVLSIDRVGSNYLDCSQLAVRVDGGRREKIWPNHRAALAAARALGRVD